ncbi:hypothetical protein Pan241w_50530 [Gimesia alba]|uniref:Putative restriction endonuclease domain-containing protein n=1 Tax=Gimesia alba TaxID=2527973 RepID=A0A517RM31_9PLAN|nr:Uma2 family endonuclease [Gimesia alba]QDT44937.1 hypothetical protein Pan241w_50530 [Gimesia alba]
MSESQIYTAEQFLEARLELPEGGRWTELDQGKIITLEPLDIEHGTIVLNISKVLSVFFHEANQGYACFDLGLIVQRDPDTVRFPAISIFKTGERFEETDKAISERKPAAIIEVASTNLRRQLMKSHVTEYVGWGVELVWVIDPQTREVLEYRLGKQSQVIDVAGKMIGGELLPEFSMKVIDLFAEPDWW